MREFWKFRSHDNIHKSSLQELMRSFEKNLEIYLFFFFFNFLPLILFFFVAFFLFKPKNEILVIILFREEHIPAIS